MTCPAPTGLIAPFQRSPDAYRVRQTLVLEEAFSVPVDGVDYVIKVAPTGAIEATVQVRGATGLETVIAAQNCLADAITRITPPALLAGDTLIVKVRGKAGVVVLFDLAWRAP